MTRTVSIPAICLAFSLFSVGCGEKERDFHENMIPLDQVPPIVMEAARKALPDVNFQDAWKDKADGQDAFEVRGMTTNGKHRDVKVSVTGKVLELD